jgi:hypothetical protein
MVSASEKYYIKDALTKPAIHHESFQKLWETKWKGPVCGRYEKQDRDEVY